MFSYISQLCVSFVMCRNMWMINSKRLLEYLFHHSKGDNYSKPLFKEKIMEDLIRISYLRYMRDMCEDLKGSYLVIMGK